MYLTLYASKLIQQWYHVIVWKGNFIRFSSSFFTIIIISCGKESREYVTVRYIFTYQCHSFLLIQWDHRVGMKLRGKKMFFSIWINFVFFAFRLLNDGSSLLVRLPSSDPLSWMTDGKCRLFPTRLRVKKNVFCCYYSVVVFFLDRKCDMICLNLAAPTTSYSPIIIV